MVLPAFVALLYAEYTDTGVFLACAAVFSLLGFLLIRRKPNKQAFFAKEGFVMVALSWLMLSLLGALPYVFSGAIPSFMDALFETVSGFTTTGATILTDVEAMSHGMLFWRSFTQWVGGMGVLVFMMAILPTVGGKGMYLMQAESTGPSVSRLMPSIRKTSMFLYIVYFAMTLIQLVLLLTAGEMPLFDAVCNALSTAGTGGFSVRNDSFASYTATAQIITTVFMVLFGIHFNFYFLLLHRRFKDACHMQEVRWYLLIYIGVSALVVWNLLATFGGDAGETVRHALFQTAAAMTTTGYAVTDYANTAVWTPFSVMLLLVLMFVGGCAGSTVGGIKVSRVVLYVKHAASGFSRMLHPRRIKVLKMDGKEVPSDTIRALHVFLFCYVAIFIVSTVVLSLDGFDLTTNATATFATLNNIGPGLGNVGPASSFADYSVLSKLMMCFNMLAGRLEIFPLVLMLIPATWKK